MKKRIKTIIICTSIVLMIIVALVVNSKSHKKYANSMGTAEYLYEMKTEYIGDNSAVAKLLSALDIGMYGKYTFELKTTEEPYILKINYNEIEGWGPINSETIIQKSTILLALITNAEGVLWTIPDNEEYYQVSTNDVSSEYGSIKNFGKSASDFKELLIKLGYEEEDFITMDIDKLSKKGITLKLENHINKDYYYGSDYLLYKKVNDEWITLNFINSCGFNAMAYSLNANQIRFETYDWEYCYGRLSKGKYRITKDFSDKTYNADSTSGNKYYISVEFEI